MNPNTTPGESFLTRMDELVRSLRQALVPAIEQAEAKSVHLCRTSARRLDAALLILSPILGKRRRKDMGRALKSVRKSLGKVRDAQVLMDHLAEQVCRPRLAVAANWLTEQLRPDIRPDPDAAPRKSTETLEDLGAYAAFREQVCEAEAAIELLLGSFVLEALDEFAELADAVSAAEPPPEQGSEAADDPHQLRIAGKSLRYALEWAESAGHTLAAHVPTQFKQMQDSLGLWHDHVVLAEFALKRLTKTSLPHHDSAMSRGVLRLAHMSLATAQNHLDAFRAQWREDGEEIRASIRAAFPLLGVSTQQPENEEAAGAPATGEFTSAADAAVVAHTGGEIESGAIESTGQ